MLGFLLAASLGATLELTSDSPACGVRRDLETAVTIRLHRNPFEQAPGPRFVVSMRRKPGGWKAALVADGGPPRVFESSDCRELTQTLALTIAIALDPSSALVLPVEEEAPTPPPSDPPLPIHLRLGLAGQLGVGLAPVVSGGGLFDVGISVGDFLGQLELRLDAPVSARLSSGAEVHSFNVLGSLLAGWQGLPWLEVLGVVSTGGLIATGTRTGTSPLLLLGVHVGFFPIRSDRFELELGLRAQGSVFQVTVLSGTTAVWTTAPVTGLLSVGVRARIF